MSESPEQRRERELLHCRLDALIDHAQLCPGPCVEMRRYELVKEQLLKVQVKRDA